MEALRQSCAKDITASFYFDRPIRVSMRLLRQRSKARPAWPGSGVIERLTLT
jgi:hypothetical protein